MIFNYCLLHFVIGFIIAFAAEVYTDDNTFGREYDFILTILIWPVMLLFIPIVVLKAVASLAIKLADKVAGR